MNNKISQQHKKAQTQCLNTLMDVKTLKMRQQTQARTIQSASEIFHTEFDDYRHCQHCIEYLAQISQLKEQINNLNKQLEISNIEKDVLIKKEEQSIKSLTQEIEKIKLLQKRQSNSFQVQLEQFITDHRTWKNYQAFLKDKEDQIQKLQDQIQQNEKDNRLFSDLLHKSYDFSLQINIKIASLSKTFIYLSSVLNKYMQLTSHLHNHTQPQLELFLPNQLQNMNVNQQLQFTNLEDMTDKILDIQLTSLISLQLQTENLIKIVQNQLNNVQQYLLNDMSRAIL